MRRGHDWPGALLMPPLTVALGSLGRIRTSRGHGDTSRKWAMEKAAEEEKSGRERVAAGMPGRGEQGARGGGNVRVRGDCGGGVLGGG
jgi:hypothetical protein